MNWNDIFIYHQGELYWKIPIGRKIRINDLAGNISKSTGYVCVKYKGITYKAQNIIWERHNGAIPEGYIVDHDNHIRSDNDITNLNLIHKAHNQKSKLIGKNNKTGLMGVCWDKRRNKWMAYIGDNGKHIHIGYYEDIEVAKEARLAYQKKLGYNPSHNTRLS